MVELVKLKIRKDHTGEKYGRLQLVEYAGSRRYRGRTSQYYTCLCDCGETVVVVYQSLKSGITKTCGKCPHIKGPEHGLWKGCGELSRWLVYTYEHSAKQRCISWEIDAEYLWDLFLKQERKCALTGWELILPKSTHDKSKNVSVDRIDSLQAYIKGNVQWVHKDVNRMKSIFSQERFIEVCNAVAAAHPVNPGVMYRKTG